MDPSQDSLSGSPGIFSENRAGPGWWCESDRDHAATIGALRLPLLEGDFRLG